MADVLSQNEIDALISAYKVSGAKETSTHEERDVRLYDFARPDKFSKEHLKSLNIIHTKYGAGFAVGLSAKLRAAIQIDLLAVDQLTYREYCASIPDSTLFVHVGLDPLTSTAIFEFNPALVSACVDLMAGGVMAPTGASEITDIDKAIMRGVLDLATKKYQEAWATCVPFKPHVVSVSTDTNSRQVLLPAEGVLVCGYEVSIGDCVSMMSICIPAAAAEAVLPALTLGRTLNVQARGTNGGPNADLRKSFQRVPVECHAVLGRTTLTLRELTDLEVGDLICLSTKSDSLTEILVGDVPKFRGTPGLKGKSLAVQIAKVIDEPYDD